MLCFFSVNTHIKYHEEQGHADKKITELTEYSKILTLSIVVIVTLGFLWNVYIKSKGKNFSFKEYILYG